MVAALRLFCGLFALATALDELPIVGTLGSMSLNGQWEASGSTRDFSGNCSYEKNVDYNPGHGVAATPIAYHGSLEQCCGLCGASATCAASVWDGSHCTFKTAADVQHRVENATGKTACSIGAIGARQLRMNATIPGDLVTDLQRAGMIGDPLLDTNFQDNASFWSGAQWQYTKKFALPPQLTPSSDVALLLVFDGVKMGATVALNGFVLGNTTNQHRRWVYEVQPHALAGSSGQEHSLTVTFDASITTEGRYMNCGGGWDWAPYSYLRDADGNPMWTRGIWKNVYMVGFERQRGAAMTYFVPQVRYVGDTYPTSPLQDGAAPFEVTARVFLLAATEGIQGDVVVEGDWINSAGANAGGAGVATVTERLPVTLHAGENAINITVRAETPRLWWPRGMGSQVLYNITARFEPDAAPVVRKGASAVTAQAVRRVGFRHVVLVTANDTDRTWVAQAQEQHLQGNGHHTLMFRVNGAPFFAKGANAIPMEALEGRYTTGMQRQLVRSAADGGMNMLRVWGGGIYPFDEFFDACDEAGVLVFEDMMYGTDGIMPGAAATPNQEAELRHQVRRMGHHASVIAWSGCNECGGMGVYTDFVMTTVAAEDQSRPVRSSCPWVGYETGVDILTGFPNGNKLTPVQPTPAPTPPVPSPTSACDFQADTDYHPETLMSTTSTNDPSVCCDACAKAPGCVVAVLYQNTCYLKAQKDSTGGNYTRAGRVACKPKLELDSLQQQIYEVSPQSSVVSKQISSFNSPFPGGDDIHGPYQHGGIFPARNGGGQLFKPPVVVDVQPSNPVGASAPGYFRTETGCSVLSSFESMSATLSPANWGMHSDPFHERNYPCDPIVLSYFNSPTTPIDLDKRGEQSFKKQTYLCMLGAAIQRKTDIESWRSGNVWGTLMWQLNEIWPTGGWGSLEYGTPSQPGQVLGGRWKPLHHFMQSSAYADIITACGNAKLQMNDAGPDASGNTLCYVKNDTPRPFSGTVIVELVHFATAQTTVLGTYNVNLGAGAGVAAFFCPDGSQDTAVCPTFESLFSKAGCSHGGADCIMRVEVRAAAGIKSSAPAAPVVLAHNVLPLAAPSAFVLPPANVTVTALNATHVRVQSISSGVALYVWLSTLANGRFADNGFLMPPGQRTIEFIHFGSIDEALLRSSLRVEHLGEHLASPF